MNRLLRALWHRLLPPGGDVVMARDAKVLRAKSWSVSIRPQPICLKDAKPEPDDLDRHGRCWWWLGRAWSLETPAIGRASQCTLWLPYSAIADPTTEP